MESDIMVKIQANKPSKTEYLVKDKDDITIGRFNITELDGLSKRCNIKLKFYRGYKCDLLKDTLVLILKTIFKDLNIFKINIKIFERVDINPFLDLGFTLEGILSQNEYYNGEYLDELLLGITRKEYNQKTKYSFIELQGDNIILRNLTPGNAEELLEYYIKNKEHLAPFEPTRDNSFYTLEVQRNILNESYRQFLNGSSIEVGIFKEERFIGKLKLSSIVCGIFKSGILGYSIDKCEEGNGYMKEAVKLFLKYLFNEEDIHRVEASALVDNEKSKGVLKSCGFKELGINEKYLLINGKWSDHLTYYIIKEDFYKK